jgi:hypothetical protein
MRYLSPALGTAGHPGGSQDARRLLWPCTSLNQTEHVLHDESMQNDHSVAIRAVKPAFDVPHIADLAHSPPSRS